MKYPIEHPSVIDITKSPYFVDNTGQTDATNAIRQALDDCVQGYISGLEKLRKKLLSLAVESHGNVYVGAEAGRVINGEVYMTMPEEAPPAKILYFPAGTYLVSDTLSYTFDNLSAPQNENYKCELCRNIHFLGEGRETTVIRLVDDAPGFGVGWADYNNKCNTRKKYRQYSYQGVKCSYHTTFLNGGKNIVLHTFYTI